MIVDYSEYITEKASKGIVNSVYVENGLPLFKMTLYVLSANKKLKM